MEYILELIRLRLRVAEQKGKGGWKANYMGVAVWMRGLFKKGYEDFRFSDGIHTIMTKTRKMGSFQILKAMKRDTNKEWPTAALCPVGPRTRDDD